MPPEVQVSDCVAGVVTLTLDRPQRKNALSIALRDEVSDRLAEVARDDAVRVVVLTGAGDVFSAGFDLKEFARIGEREVADRIWASSDRFHRALIEFPLPTIASVNGAALAGGFDLALMCDLRIASQRASFAHPEVAFGTVAYGLLHDLVGGALARELTLTAARWTRTKLWRAVSSLASHRPTRSPPPPASSRSPSPAGLATCCSTTSARSSAGRRT